MLVQTEMEYPANNRTHLCYFHNITTAVTHLNLNTYRVLSKFGEEKAKMDSNLEQFQPEGKALKTTELLCMKN